MSQSVCIAQARQAQVKFKTLTKDGTCKHSFARTNEVTYLVPSQTWVLDGKPM